MELLLYLLSVVAAPCPVESDRISSEYGFRRDPYTGARKFHTGVDLAAPEGRKVVAPYPGVVERVRRMGPYGLTVVVRSGRARWQFSHLSSAAVYPSQIVRPYEKLGEVGQSGRATGPHLHVELRKPNDRSMDPLLILWRCRL